jgi:GPI mannosyltransferase 3
MRPAIPKRLRTHAGLIVPALLVLLAAFFSRGMFHLDEHYMTLEFAALKLGRSSAELAPLEYGLQMRAWLLPWLHTGIVRASMLLGIENPWSQAIVIRLAHGGLFLFATRCLLLTRSQRILARGASVHGIWMFAFFPYLAVRTSAENFGGSVIALGIVLGEYVLACAPSQRRNGGVLGAAWGTGALFACAFAARYQLLFAPLGYVVSIALRRKHPKVIHVAAALSGFLLTLVCASWIDRWGYGAWAFPLREYYKQNIVLGMASSFGTEPWYAFLYLPLSNLAFPAAALSLVLLLMHVVKEPRSPLACVVLALVVGQSLFAHKEERFVFPIVPLVLVMVAEELPKLAAWMQHKMGARLTQVFRATFWSANSAVLVILLFVPVNWRGAIGIHRALASVASGDVLDTSGTWKMPFYMQAGLSKRWLTIPAKALPSEVLSRTARGETVYIVQSDPVGQSAHAGHLQSLAKACRGHCEVSRLYADLAAIPWLGESRWRNLAALLPTQQEWEGLPQVEWKALYRIVPAGPVKAQP